MPDTTSLPLAEGGRPSGGGGLPIPLLLLGGGGLILVLLIATRGGGSGASGTTAAGASINAALGSIEEQNLNLMGQVGKAQQDTASLLGGVDSHVGALDQSLSGQLSNLNNGMIAGNQNLLSQINFVSGQVGQVYGQTRENQLILTNPWVKEWYQNQTLNTLSDYEKNMYWWLTAQQAQGLPSGWQQINGQAPQVVSAQ